MTDRVEIKLTLARQFWCRLKWTFHNLKLNNFLMNLIEWLTREFSASRRAMLLSVFTGAAVMLTQAETNTPVPILQIKADQVTTKVSPMLYGLMTEEINFSYEGGLYGELIRNRAFKTDASEVKFWSTVGGATMTLDTTVPLNDALNLSLKLDAAGATKNSPAGIANGGYWGIPVKPKTTYHVSFFAKAADGFDGPLTVSLASTNGKTFASAEISGLTGDWKKFEVDLKTKSVRPSKDNICKITTTSPGTIWFQQVSLFPPTFNHRTNGNRPDIMQLLADMQPKFLRLPGGNYLEGDYINERFDWKKTIGDTSQRPGHRSPWNYWSTDGFGLMEYLEWCEDLHMEPLLAVFAGYALRHDYIKPGPDLEPYVQDALDEIEYITGDAATTRWGAQRAKDGHPAPFPLHYIEVGNEDWFDRSGSYDGRFAQFFNAIKAKYPQLQVIATADVKSSVPDLIDEHYYRSQEEMESQSHMYDMRKRGGKTKVFVGEWATRVGSPTPNMAGALGDAAWMCCLERNSDLVVMESYAPLFVNVSDLKHGGSMQWPSDLIGYDALTSYGSPSYYAQVIFSTHHGDNVLATDSQNIPTYTWQPVARRRNGTEQPRQAPQQVPSLFFDATRASASGTIYLKVVNRAATPQPVKIEISGVTGIESKGSTIVLKANRPDDTNSIQEPKKIVPLFQKTRGLGTNFTRTFPPCSISILELKAK
jgi:alpha-N-arabinofuranosidase